MIWFLETYTLGLLLAWLTFFVALRWDVLLYSVTYRAATAWYDARLDVMDEAQPIEARDTAKDMADEADASEQRYAQGIEVYNLRNASPDGIPVPEQVYLVWDEDSGEYIQVKPTVS